MANSSTPTPIAQLDFDDILKNFRNFLKSQTIFQDYNFDGSAITELLKLLSYNTFYNAFYVNTIGSEMFLDSATDRSSVVSRAKSLGYIPSSAKSSKAYVNLEAHIVPTGNTIAGTNSTISLLPYSSFTTSIGSASYNFITNSLNNLQYSYSANTYDVYKKYNVEIVEGKALNYAFFVQDFYQQYSIPNKNIDIDSLIVRVYDNSSSLTYTTYTKANTMIDASLTGSSTVYWIYEGIDGTYYLQFGNDKLGKSLSIGNIIYIEYITTNGSMGNGAKMFSIGNYTYSDSSLMESNALTITPSEYITLAVKNISDSFTANSSIRGETSNITAIIDSYNPVTSSIVLYGLDYSNAVSNTFLYNEVIHEEFKIGANTIFGSNGSVASIFSEISTSTGGSDIESISDIQFTAPKLFATQNRLVTASDYEAIIKNNYPYIDDVICWGGEEEIPQKLGNIYVSVKPKSRFSLDSWEKNYILSNIIESKKMISMTVNIVDPDYIYIYPSSIIKYNADLTSIISQEGIEVLVNNAINSYAITNLNTFKNSFYYSSFCTTIDNSNEFILGNDTSIQLVKEFTPTLNIPYTSNNEYILNYSNPIGINVDDTPIWSSTFTCNISSLTYDFTPTLDIPYTSNNIADIAFNASLSSNSISNISSSAFSCNVDSVIIANCEFTVSSSNNSILSVLCTSNSTIVIDNAGHIDYSNGNIYISNVNIHTTNLTNYLSNPLIVLNSTPMPFAGCSFYCNTVNSNILSVMQGSNTVIYNAGSIDYANGLINISNVNIMSTDSYDSAYNSIIDLYLTPASNDLVCTKEQILSIYKQLNIIAKPIRTIK